MRRILYIASHRPDRAPSQRFRFEQFMPSLQAKGWRVDHSHLINANDDAVLYRPGKRWYKALFALRCLWKRCRDALRAHQYDVIYIHREALMFGPPIFEMVFCRSNAMVVFDFDDAVWLGAEGKAGRVKQWLRYNRKTATIIRRVDLVLAGNQYLADYAMQFSKSVEIVPTTIDTNKYAPKVSSRRQDRICVGWSGSFSTITYFGAMEPVLIAIKRQWGDRVYFKVIGDGTYQNNELGVRGIPWRSSTEVDDLSEIDIGIMPLTDDAWSRGKCGLKGLQYMALGIPTIMSPVGVNKHIVQHGENGFLASTDDEWKLCLSLLIGDADMRTRIGRAGRETVVQRYSLDSQMPRFEALMGHAGTSDGRT